MKIIHIIEASATGTLSMASLLANAQVKAGHSVGVIFSRRPETPEDFASHFDSSVQLHHIQMHNMQEKLKSIPQLRILLKKAVPDVVFLHSSFSGFLGRLAALCILPKTRFFYLPHCISFMRQDVGRLKKLIFIAFEWVAAIKTADYVACSESEQKTIRAAIPFRPCHLVENALDFNSIPAPNNLALGERSKMVITVGQIRPQKGPDIFARIAREVKNADPAINFLWVGDGDPVQRAKLEAADIHVTGWVSKSQVWEYLGNARLYLSTALWEGMPVSLIEAGCVGLPVVASSCPGNIDVVVHERTGWLYQSSAEASKYVLTALNDLGLSQSIAQSAFEIAKKRFKVERYIREMEELIQLQTR